MCMLRHIPYTYICTWVFIYTYTHTHIVHIHIYCMKVKVAQSCLTLCDPMDHTVHGILQARILEWVAVPFSRGSSQPRDRTQVSHIAGDSLPAEPHRKPKKARVGSLSLLQRIVPIQELNRGLLHCRWILYQLSYQGSKFSLWLCKNHSTLLVLSCIHFNTS